MSRTTSTGPASHRAGHASAVGRLATLATRCVAGPLVSAVPPGPLGARVVDAALHALMVPPSWLDDRRALPVHTVGALGPVRGEWVIAPDATDAAPPVLYVHGGAAVSGSPATHRGWVTRLSARSGRPVFALDYRLVPEHSASAADRDVVAALRWLADLRPHDTVGIAADATGARPVLAAVSSVPADLARRLDALVLTAPVLGPDGTAWDRFRAWGDPACPPPGVDPARFPATSVQIGVADHGRAAASALCERLRAAGCEVVHVERPGYVYTLPALYRLLPEADVVLDAAGTFLAARGVRSRPPTLVVVDGGDRIDDDARER